MWGPVCKAKQNFYQKFDIPSFPDSNPKPWDDDSSVLPLSYRIWPTGVKVEKPPVSTFIDIFTSLLDFSLASLGKVSMIKQD